MTRLDGLARRAAPATRSSTPGCGSCSPRAGCTTGCGWSPRASWSRTCTCGGRVGARHFLDHLLDGDLASNNHGWQWVAGTGTDAAPYFRVFNPVTQGKRFDPDGDVRPPVGARARPPRRSRGARAVAARGRLRPRLPRRIVDHDDERRESLRRYDQARKRPGVTHAIVEVRAFLRAALASPVPGIAEDPPRGPTPPTVGGRGDTCSSARCVLAATLRIEPGDARFYWAGIGLAAVWAAGAFASGPMHLGTAPHPRPRVRPSGRPVPRSWAFSPLAVCLLAAALVARAPTLREPVDDLLDHARFGSLPAVLVITVLNGIAEELYFRGALYAALRRTHPVAVTTVLYALTTVGSGIPLLVIAALLIGLLTALQRRVTGGVLGPIIIHLTWSVGMLLLLPPVLESAR